MVQRLSLRSLIAALLIAAVSLTTAEAQGPTRLLRFPHINGDTVAFTYAGDLYTAPLAGGTATRLTSHEGLEIFAKFSPDGRWIAFSGEYAGSRQVYVIKILSKHNRGRSLRSAGTVSPRMSSYF